MAPQTGTAVLVIAVFVLPGFVTLLLRERAYVVSSDESAFERLLGALYYSSIIFGVLAVMALVAGVSVDDVTRLWHGHASLGVYAALAAVGLVILPIGIAQVGLAWKKSKRLRPSFLATKQALPIEKRGGISLQNVGPRPKTAPPKPSDAASSARSPAASART